MKIRAMVTFEVDVFCIDDQGEDLDSGWYAVVRNYDGGALWIGPYETRKAVVAATKKGLSDR